MANLGGFLGLGLSAQEEQKLRAGLDSTQGLKGFNTAQGNVVTSNKADKQGFYFSVGGGSQTFMSTSQLYGLAGRQEQGPAIPSTPQYDLNPLEEYGPAIPEQQGPPIPEQQQTAPQQQQQYADNSGDTGVFDPSLSHGGNPPSTALDALLGLNNTGYGGNGNGSGNTNTTQTPTGSSSISFVSGASAGSQPNKNLVQQASNYGAAQTEADLNYQEQTKKLYGDRRKGILSTILNGDATGGSPLLIKPTLLGN